MRAQSEATSTAAFAVSATVAGTFKKVDCAICATACSLVMFSSPERKPKAGAHGGCASGLVNCQATCVSCDLIVGEEGIA